jgi:hypothetical protein
VKINPKADAYTLSPPDEAPGKYCLSKLLGISMDNLWEVLIACTLAKQKGKRGNIVDRNGIQQLITYNGLTNMVILDIKEKQSVLRIGIFMPNSLASNHSATPQWKSKNRLPLSLRNVSKEFCQICQNLAIHSNLQVKQKGLLLEKSIMDVPVPFALPDEEPPPEEQSPTESPLKAEKAVSAAVAVNCFEESINPKDYPTLDSKGICLKTDRDIKAVLRDIIKLVKKV